jgi:hypothetical protein
MYGIVLMAALAGSGEAPAGHKHAVWDGYYGYYGPTDNVGWWFVNPFHHSCTGYTGWVGGSCCGCCGHVIPGLAGYGPPPTVSAADQKKWDDYVSLFTTEQDTTYLKELWQQADKAGRTRLVAMIPSPEETKRDPKKVEEKPLTPAEQMRWNAYIKTLEGAARKQQIDAWNKADLKGKRDLLKKIPDE